MKAGKLDKRIVFERRSLSSDAEGSTIETWSRLISRWANINITNASETFRNDQDFNARTGFVIVRKDSGTDQLTVDDRFYYLGQAWEILGIINMQEDDRYYELSIRRYEN